MSTHFLWKDAVVAFPYVPVPWLHCCRSNNGDTLIVTSELNYLEGPLFPFMVWGQDIGVCCETAQLRTQSSSFVGNSHTGLLFRLSDNASIAISPHQISLLHLVWVDPAYFMILKLSQGTSFLLILPLPLFYGKQVDDRTRQESWNGASSSLIEEIKHL